MVSLSDLKPAGTGIVLANGSGVFCLLLFPGLCVPVTDASQCFSSVAHLVPDPTVGPPVV